MVSMERPPTPVDPEVQKKVLKGYKRGETPITGRAADFLEPELAKDREAIGDLAKTEEDLLTYALYPTTGEQFLKWKYGVEEKPQSVKPKTLEDVKREDELLEKARAEARGKDTFSKYSFKNKTRKKGGKKWLN